MPLATGAGSVQADGASLGSQGLPGPAEGCRQPREGRCWVRGEQGERSSQCLIHGVLSALTKVTGGTADLSE